MRGANAPLHFYAGFPPALRPRKSGASACGNDGLWVSFGLCKQALRKNMTDAEKRLWRNLRNRQLESHKFYRQYPTPPYYADFLCRDKKLVVEADGGQHNDNPDDEKRTAFLEAQGFKVIRYWNNEILKNTEGVLEDILAVLKTLTPTLSLKGEGASYRGTPPCTRPEFYSLS